MTSKPAKPNAADGPMQQRRIRGAAVPERPDADDPDTPDHEGIEIDNAIERPQHGQPGQPGAKVE